MGQMINAERIILKRESDNLRDLEVDGSIILQ
jgi:hypothetical protein